MKKEVNKGGRPSKFKPEYIAKVDEYLKQTKDEYDDKQRLKVNLPTIEKFGDYLGVANSTLYEWKKSNKEFSRALKKIVERQRANLLDSGLSGAYNPTIAKLVLSANHGFSEKTEQKIEVSGFGKGHDELLRLEREGLI